MNIYNDNENVTADFDEREYEDNNKIASNQAEMPDEFIRPAREILEECLKASYFGEHREELYSLCAAYFPELRDSIDRSDRVPAIRRILIEYCMVKGVTEKLWSVLKEKRRGWHDKFYHQWEKSIENEENEKILQQRDNENEKILDEQSEWKGENVVGWFFDEKLVDIQKSMVITAALFQGVEKGTFHSLVAHIHRLLFPVIAHEQFSEKYSIEEEGDEYKKETEAVSLYQPLEDEQKQFEAAKIKVVSSYRYGHFGRTEVDTVIFETKEYRKEILKMLRYNISYKKQDIFSLIHKLGTDKSREKR